jgi:hypothetical protein
MYDFCRILRACAVACVSAATVAAQTVSPECAGTTCSVPAAKPAFAFVEEPNYRAAQGGRSERLWLNFEYLHWRAAGDRVPALLAGSPPGTPQAETGVLEQPGTTILHGMQALNGGLRSGWRGTATWWMNDRTGVDFGAFGLGGSRASFATAPNETDLVARPFLNAETGLQDSELVNFPGLVSGGAAISHASSGVLGANAGLRRNLWRSCPSACSCGPLGRIDLLGGYRFLQFRDALEIREDLTATATDSVVEPGTRFLVADRFATLNTYHGGYLGLVAERQRGGWFAQISAKFGVGSLTNRTVIAGETTVATPDGTSVTNAGGLLAVASNSGTYLSRRTVFVPEIGVKVGRQFGDRARLYVGYDFLRLPGAIRAGNVVDTALNPTQLPPGELLGAARPAFAPSRSGYWLQGLTAGLQLRF